MKNLAALTILLAASNLMAHSILSHQPPYKNEILDHQAEPPLEIIKEGHPTLRLVAEPVTEEDLASEEFQVFIDDLAQTMKLAGGVGIAAPQVNVSKRLFVMGGSFSGIPLTYVLNPELTYFTDKGMKQSTEGCLSIPRKRYVVPRYKELHIDYFDRTGLAVSEDVKGFKAIVIQHEYDHLEGILISDFIESLFEFTGVLL